MATTTRFASWAACLLLLAAGAGVSGLDNGLALTPPMGWLSWERFRCTTKCNANLDNCIGEGLFKQMADRMAEDGYLQAGYEYLIIDDCWLDMIRDADGCLQPDHTRFPSGIKALADYVHGKGLKFGIYGDIGTKTCGGYPGMQGSFAVDAQTYADWGVDYLKVDGCYADTDTFGETYPELGAALNATGRPMVYSCSWPAYLPDPVASRFQVPYEDMAKHCNLWRNWADIDHTWPSIQGIIQHWRSAGKLSKGFTDIAGPGQWNDPDMVLVGNEAIAPSQWRVQMGMWAIFAAPLILSNDLRNISKDAAAILLNRDVIAVNQDPLGKQGVLVDCPDGCSASQLWKRELSGGALAVAYLNLDDATSRMLCVAWADLGLAPDATMGVYDLFGQQDAGTATGSLCAPVQRTDMQLLRLTLQPAQAAGGWRGGLTRLWRAAARAALLWRPKAVQANVSM